MSRPPAHWLAGVFVAFGIGAVLVFGLMAAGRLRVDGEWPGFVVGGLLIAAMVLALRR